MENSLKFTEAENKIRKKWLFWSTQLPCFVIGLFMIIHIYDIFITENFTKLTGFILSSICFSGVFYVNYHCAYKNPGTALLLSEIILISLNLLVIFLRLKILVLLKISVVFSLFMLTVLIFEFIVFYYSYKLRKINKKMQERKLIVSPVYIDALPVFSTATSLEELDEQFTKLRDSHDLRSAIRALAKAYDQQKKMLKLANNSLK